MNEVALISPFIGGDRTPETLDQRPRNRNLLSMTSWLFRRPHVEAPTTVKSLGNVVLGSGGWVLTAHNLDQYFPAGTIAPWDSQAENTKGNLFPGAGV